MKRSVHCESFGIQKVAACACLLALLLVYAPIAGATLMSVTGACCTGDQCPIHGNHHPSKHDEPAAMDCHADKHNVNQMDSCSISCCHTDQRAALNANIFVLTPISVSMPLLANTQTFLAFAATGLCLAFAPLAPPPKSFLG
jgi:hypothetical protein